MYLKKDNNLNLLAETANKSIGEVEKILISELINNHIVADEPDFWASTLRENIDYDISVVTLVEIMKKAGITDVRAEHFEAFLSITLIGKGDCPICGGMLEVEDGEYRLAGGDGYITPFEYKAIWEKRKCNNCGYIQF